MSGGVGRQYAMTALAVVMGAQFGALMAWFMVEWPEPPDAIVLRVLGWSFFVPWGVLLGVAVREASR